MTLNFSKLPLFIGLTAIAAAITGCTNTSVMALGQDSFLLTTKGGAVVSDERIQNETMLEAAKTCLSKGYLSFIVVGMGDASETAYVGGYSSSTQGQFNGMGRYTENTTYNTPTAMKKPGIKIQIKCFREIYSDAIDAKAYIEANTPKKNNAAR